ncbi:35098_t:CDS:1, partial [Racocetra persica]
VNTTKNNIKSYFNSEFTITKHSKDLSGWKKYATTNSVQEASTKLISELAQ